MFEATAYPFAEMAINSLPSSDNYSSSRRSNTGFWISLFLIIGFFTYLIIKIKREYDEVEPLKVPLANDRPRI